VSFKDIRGQDKAIAILKNAARQDKLSHAYIFWGPEGVGKSMTALNFAKMLNCQDARDEEPCEECASCKKINSFNHPDVFLFSPDKEGSSVGIEKIRALIKDIGLKPYEAKKKIYIVDNAQALTREAANAFLKTLEEPPTDALLILIAPELRDLLPTIVSRSQAVKFYALGVNETARILVKEHKIDEPQAKTLAHLSSGRLGVALKYKDDDFLKKRNRIVDSLARNEFFDSDFDAVSKPELKAYLDIALTWYRDILITKASGADAVFGLVNIDKSDAIKKEAKRLEFSRIEEIIKQIILTGSFLDSNANPKLTIAVLGLAALENVR
jgi:DNA polymerase-3 subunit delta'